MRLLILLWHMPRLPRSFMHNHTSCSGMLSQCLGKTTVAMAAGMRSRHYCGTAARRRRPRESGTSRSCWHRLRRDFLPTFQLQTLPVQLLWVIHAHAGTWWGFCFMMLAHYEGGQALAQALLSAAEASAVNEARAHAEVVAHGAAAAALHGRLAAQRRRRAAAQAAMAAEHAGARQVQCSGMLADLPGLTCSCYAPLHRHKQTREWQYVRSGVFCTTSRIALWTYRSCACGTAPD